jgi:hypothetical protein
LESIYVCRLDLKSQKKSNTKTRKRPRGKKSEKKKKGTKKEGRSRKILWPVI